MDDMKGINDRFGHEVGDAAIKATAEILMSACAPGDFLMRYGGDEFLIIASPAEAALPEAIQAAVAAHASRAELPCALSLSIGAVHADAAQDSVLDECVQRADVRMYESKNCRRRAR